MAHILVVDDEQYMREMLRDMLEEAGHDVETACDGVEGLSRFRAKRPALVITDLLMPTKGGLNVIKEVRATHSDQPVIAISGGGKDGKLNFLSTARTFPGVKTLKKPFGHRDLLAVVEEVLVWAKGRHGDLHRPSWRGASARKNGERQVPDGKVQTRLERTNRKERHASHNPIEIRDSEPRTAHALFRQADADVARRAAAGPAGYLFLYLLAVTVNPFYQNSPVVGVTSGRGL